MINLALVSHGPNMHGSESSLVSLAGLFSNDFNSSKRKSDEINSILMIPERKEGEMAKVAQCRGTNMLYTPPNLWYIYRSPNNAENFHIYCKQVKEDVEKFIELFKEVKADIVVVNTLTTFVPHIAASILKIPAITWIHGVIDPLVVPGIDAFYQSFIDRAVISLSHKIIYCSSWTEKQFRHIVNEKDSITIPNWTLEPLVHVPYDVSSDKFICLNTMDSKKGINILVDAAKILKDRGYNFHVALYGIGHEIQNIINQINALELNDCVSVNPRTTNVSELYSQCAALIQPSFYESFGRTIIEAMSHKRPVIAATTADPEKIISDGKSGFYVEPGNSKQLAEKMIYVLNNKEKVKRIAEKGYKVYKSRFNGDIAKKKITRLIYTLHKKGFHQSDMQKFTFDALNLIHR